MVLVWALNHQNPVVFLTPREMRSCSGRGQSMLPEGASPKSLEQSWFCLSITLTPALYPQHLHNFLSSGTCRTHIQRCQHLPLLLQPHPEMLTPSSTVVPTSCCHGSPNPKLLADNNAPSSCCLPWHLTRFVSCVSIMKLWTCFSALVSSSFLATTATTSAVHPAPCPGTLVGETVCHPFVTPALPPSSLQSAN